MILKALGYKLNYVTFFHLVMFLLSYGALDGEKERLPIEYKDELKEIIEYIKNENNNNHISRELIEKICSICDYVVYNNNIIVFENDKIAIIYYFREVCKFKTLWPEKFERLFEIDFDHFKDVYEMIKKYIITDLAIKVLKRRSFTKNLTLKQSGISSNQQISSE
jgi:hypothetical protein